MDTEKMKEASEASRRTEYFATPEKPFHFVDSGLDNVYLVGIKYFEDENGDTIAEIPALEQVMQLIARDLTMSPRDLTGKEIRFLRKRLGKKAAEYCTYLGLEPESLSRTENEKQPVSQQVQKLARLSYCLLSGDQSLLNCAGTILREISYAYAARKKIVLEMRDNREWQELIAA